MIKPKSKPKKLINLGNCRKTIHDEKKQVKDHSCTGITQPYIGLAGKPGWLGSQVGWEARLAGRPGWPEGQTGLYLILHLVNNSTLSTNRLS